MKHRWILLALTAAILLGGQSSAHARTADETADKIESLQKQIDELRMDYEMLQEDVDRGKLKFDNYTLKGFFDMSYTIEDTDNQSEEKSDTFDMGQFDIFFTAQLTDEISVLNENVIEFDNNDETDFDLERLWIKYAFSDLLKLKLGRVHTPIGFWHTAYHHGTWLQTTAFRPRILRWEGHSEKGILPMHSVGVEASGVLQGDDLAFEYALNLTNGRGKTSNRVQMTQDDNDHKAINAYFRLKPTAIPGLMFGGNVYIDKIPPDSTVSARNGEINERILGSYLAYLQGNYEFLAEIVHIEHHDKVTRKYFDTLGFYIQAAYQINDLKPYYRFDFIDLGEGDPFYSPGFYGLSQHTLGLRWDLNPWAAIKFEGSLTDWTGKSNATSFTTNVAFHF